MFRLLHINVFLYSIEFLGGGVQEIFLRPNCSALHFISIFNYLTTLLHSNLLLFNYS